jgi:uncharacterized hydrophobic protein (TIGR00271 family)
MHPGRRAYDSAAVLHLRIVVPSYQSEHTLELLDNTPSVCNLVFLERAARRPEGDVILCDVAREDASVVIADLRELDIDTEGSIAIEEIDSEISEFASKAAQAASGRGTEPVVWEQLATRTSESVEMTPSFLLYMVLAMLIAAVGIYFNQPILIVGAMVVGPEFGPISGVVVALVNREPELARRSIKALAVGFPLGMVVTFLATGALILTGQLPDSINFDSHTLTRFIAHPDFFTFYVSLIAGVVGMLSLTASKSSVLVGVLISVTTIPAAANMGVAAAYGDWDTVLGAQLQLIINLGGIFAASLATLYIQRRFYVRQRHKHLSDESRRIAGLPVGQSRRAQIKAAEEVDPL